MVSGALLLACVAIHAHAQSASAVRQVGWLSGRAAGQTSEAESAFRDAMRDLGWVEGRNLRILFRYSDGQLDRLSEMAAEMVRLKVDVIVATVPAALAAARKATTSIPIVMVFGPDPVETGVVASLSHPGGNVTGLTSLSADLGRKQLELLKEMLPAVSRVGVLWNSTNPWHEAGVKRVEAAAKEIGVRVHPVPVRDARELEPAFAAFAKERDEAVLTLADPLTFVHRARLAEIAVRHRLATMNGLIEYTEAGGLASYWPNSVEMFRRSAGYVHRILGGARPGELAIEQPTQFELALNLKTAKALGVTIPSSLLLRADRIVE
jgi:putative ABC transport system substrate-binding protein